MIDKYGPVLYWRHVVRSWVRWGLRDCRKRRACVFFGENTPKNAKKRGKVEISTYGLEFLFEGLEFLSSDARPEGTQKPRVEPASISFFLNSL